MFHGALRYLPGVPEDLVHASNCASNAVERIYVVFEDLDVFLGHNNNFEDLVQASKSPGTPCAFLKT